MKRKNKIPLIELPVPTEDGEFVARYSGTGLAALDFPSRRKPELPNEIPASVRGWHRATIIALKRALAGRAPRVLPPLDLSAGTDFQQRVWSALLKIRPGETSSYAEIASSIRHARAVRAVGSACGANPVPVLVPCHRVLAAKHRLGGYSGGLKWKRLLLWREGSRDWWEKSNRA